MLEATEKFFNLPVKDRMAYFSSDMTKPLRYGTSHNPTIDSALQWRDCMYLPCKLAEENVQTWPAVYRKEALDYVKEMNNLTEILLELMSESLHLAPNTLRNVLGPDMLHNMVLNYYPACPQPDLTIGFREHSDKSTITILLQDEIGGLEVSHKDCWVPVQPLKDALLVNLGDVMEILSNGRYKSIAHRVIVNSNSKRLSIGSFYNVAYNAIISPLPHCVDETHPLAFKKVMFMDFFKKFVSRDLDGKNALDYVKITPIEEP
ncbi:hypothetical protein O6H91_21G000500 [Diphasiastrum complanatum]|uniref:Uncharacterized protein n=1 Tax=Diphasiastrum complanatum TaxID=34168 RepID=A0ACC2AGZ5_DIPCM|nr:hypothetical protein O6H91_21G000500 [Diphasiastrum complanatum]